MNFIVLKFGGAKFVPFQQAQMVYEELQKTKLANKNLQTMLDLVLKAKGR